MRAVIIACALTFSACAGIPEGSDKAYDHNQALSEHKHQSEAMRRHQSTILKDQSRRVEAAKTRQQNILNGNPPPPDAPTLPPPNILKRSN